MQKRVVGRLIEEDMMSCHTYDRARRLAERPVVLAAELRREDRRKLDEAVFELLGAIDPVERAELVDQLYHETARHFRAIRVVEIQKTEDRAKGGSRRFVASDLAADAWDAIDFDDVKPLTEWVEMHPESPCEDFEIPSERPVQLSDDHMFDTETVYFGRKQEWYLECSSRGQAELIARMAQLGVTGDVTVPQKLHEAMQLLDRLNHRHESTMTRLRELAESRTGDEETCEQVVKLLERWFVLGRPNGHRHDDDGSE